MKAAEVSSVLQCGTLLTGRWRIEMEAFDEALDRRIWSLADTRLQWHKRIAEARRTIPKEIETNVSTLIQQHRELDNASLSQTKDMEEPMPDEIREHLGLYDDDR